MDLKNRNFIKESNRRSKAYGIDVKQKESKKVLNQNELDEKIKEKSNLIMTSSPFIENLYNLVKGSNFFAILTDEEGCILNMIGDDDILKKSFQNALVPGAYMGEEYMGTNGMGTAIVEERPLQVSGKEHYVEVFHKWTCSGAPIRNPKGEIIGSLNLTGDIKNVHPHTLGIVAAAVNAIENMLKIKEYNKKLALSKNYIETILNSIPAAILTSDFSGKIKMANNYLEKMFGYTENEIKKKNIREVIRDWDSIAKEIKKGEDVLQKDVYVNLGLNKEEVNVSAYPVLDNLGIVQEIVLVFKDVKKVRKLANRITGSRAIYTFDKIIGESEVIKNTIEYAKKISDSKSTVLILGESGTGKESFAQSIQNHSKRREESFVAINCGAIPKNLIESELFGYVEGSFTGAKKGGHPGKFEIADGGTIFLDEIGEMSLDLQTRLLRVIEEGIVRRIGGNDEIPINVRIIAATNKDLREEVKNGNFRTDLYYRLNVLPLKLPPLRERKEDIPLLIEYFMKRISKKLNKKEIEIPKEYMEYLLDYSWPGNIRELENFIELIINTEHLPMDFFSKNIKHNGNATIETKENLSLEEVERIHIEKILNRTEGNISKSSEILGVSRNTLYRKIKEYKINVS
jgi:PAS domain S-box-containing protein